MGNTHFVAVFHLQSGILLSITSLDVASSILCNSKLMAASKDRYAIQIFFLDVPAILIEKGHKL